MKRFHVHVAVDDLAQSTRFYSALFGAAPAVEKADYVKWMLDDPRVNFAISARGQSPGVNHLGLQVDPRSATLPLMSNLSTMSDDMRAHLVKDRDRFETIYKKLVAAGVKLRRLPPRRPLRVRHRRPQRQGRPLRRGSAKAPIARNGAAGPIRDFLRAAGTPA